MKAEFKVITRDLAVELLEKNNTNRKIRKKKVDQYCRDLENGRFVTTHQGVAVYENGSLADGQHRLMAIVKTGIPVRLLIVTGIPYDADHILAIDSGSGRSVTDSSTISGSKVKAKDKSVIVWLEKYGLPHTERTGMTHHEIVELSKKYSDEIDFLNRVMPKHCAGITITPIKVAMCRLWNDGVDEEILAEFSDFLVTGFPFELCRQKHMKLRDKLLSQSHNRPNDAVALELKV